MRYINWNISYTGSTQRKIDYLSKLILEDTCVILQEVKPHAYEYIMNVLGEKFNLFYSLKYREPSKFDSDARKLGVLIMVSKTIDIVSSGVIERSPFPDRTIYVTLRKNNVEMKVLGLHSLTGCGYYRTKSVQYDSFAEFIDEYRPDIIGIDANEPKLDHYDIKKMEFFDNGPGAKHFFDEIENIGLVDSYARFVGSVGYIEGQPLIKSHNIRRKGAVRYDFLFVKNSYNLKEVFYNYDDAITAGSDHAIIVGDLSAE